MKYMNKKIKTKDPLKELKEDRDFSLYEKDARVQIRLAVEIYNKRKERAWSQTKLAEVIGTTQKVISNIESGDVNIGINLLKRLVDALNLSEHDLGNIFESCFCLTFSSQSDTLTQEKKYVSAYMEKRYGEQFVMSSSATINI